MMVNQISKQLITDFQSHLTSISLNLEDDVIRSLI